MNAQISDTQIRASVRATLTQLRVDVQSLSIASARGVPAGTIKSHLSRARRRLAAQSSEEDRTHEST